MQRRTLLLRLCVSLLLFAGSLLAPNQLAAQVRIAREAIVDASEVDEILRIGEQLEQERRWGEALVHYEDAFRRHPERGDLQQRLDLTKLHYDVTRRYGDSSFVRSIKTLRDMDAVDLYGEVLLKIHAHYVERPDWQELIRRGTRAVEVALHEEPVVDRFEIRDTPAERAAFMAELRRQLGQHLYRNRHEVRDAARYAAEMVQRRYGMPVSAVMLEFACAAVGALDSYSAFLTEHQLDEVLSQIEGNFVGLGIELKADNGSLLIVHVIEGGPADAAGLRPNERIVRVDHFDTTAVSTDVAADMLKGPEGSTVELKVQDAQGQRRVLRVTRARVDVPSVDRVAMIDQQYGIGYLRLVSFQKTTSRDVEAALWSLHRQGMRSVIIDVRGNPGGLLTAAVEVADKFISRGAVVSTRGRSSGEDYDYQAHLVGTWRVPLTVLIDGDSASASEIFAGAIRDHRRGTLVGSRTYGKGSVQGIFPLSIGNVGVRLTTAKFYSPHGTPISRRGVAPDQAVRTVARPVNSGGVVVEDAPATDQVLNAAVQVARQQVALR